MKVPAAPLRSPLRFAGRAFVLQSAMFGRDLALEHQGRRARVVSDGETDGWRYRLLVLPARR